MAYCKNCGAQVDPEAYVCVKCGCLVNDAPAKSSSSDIPAILWGLIGYFVPVAGLILWLLWKAERPKDAKAAGLGALINAIFAAIVIIAYLFIYFFMLFVMFGGMALSSGAY